MDSRRNFLGKVASGLGTLAAVPARVLGANDRIRVGFIGFGDRGADLLNHVRACPHTEAVAFCDVFTRQRDRSRSLVPGAAVYSDHRQMLEDSSIDAVVIATPPHLHAAHFCDAIDSGKHVYLEKTMAFTLDHARRMRTMFERDGGRHVVQIGHQACSSGHMRDVQMFLSEPERVGKITMIGMRMFRNTPRVNPRLTSAIDAESLDWKAFLGDAPARAFDPYRFLNWRFFWDYSGAGVYESMSQQLAFWYKALDLNIPRASTSVGGTFLWKDGREIPDTLNVSLEQPEEMLIHWAACVGKSHPLVGEDVLGANGCISRDALVRYSPQKNHRPGGNEMTGRSSHVPQAHMENFFDCVRAGAEPNCPFELGWRVSIAARMAVDSYRLGRTVRWDSTHEEIV